jgi:uncharacterized delta-60 repeat protein
MEGRVALTIKVALFNPEWSLDTWCGHGRINVPTFKGASPMRHVLSRKRVFGAFDRRYVRPRLEALEDRFLLSGSPGPDYTAILTSVKLDATKEVVLPDGKVLVGGTTTSSAIELARFNPNGSLDATFGNGGVVDFHPVLSDIFSNFAVQPDGKIVVVGSESVSGFWQDSGLLVVRFNADGSLDSTFTASASQDIPRIHPENLWPDIPAAVTVQPDGKIVVAAADQQFGLPSVVVVRYDADGSLDTTFNPRSTTPGVVTTTFTTDPNSQYLFVSTVALQSDDKIVVGAADSTELVALRYDADGSPDIGFGFGGVAFYATPAGSPPYSPSGLVIQPDGKILLGGSLVNSLAGMDIGLPVGGLLMVRFDTDGKLDTSFGEQGAVLMGTPDDPLGPFSIDLPSAGAGHGAGPVESHLLWQTTAGFIVQPNGDIVVSGSAFGDPDTGYANEWAVARFNPDGTPDATFGTQGIQLVNYGTTEADAVPWAVAATPDGGFVVVGHLYFTSLSLVDTLVLVEYGPNPAAQLSTPSSPSATAHVVSPSDAVFASLADRSKIIGSPAAQLTADPPAFLTSSPSITVDLPIPSESQSEAVARISGGGGATVAADDVLGPTGDSDRAWNVVCTRVADGSAE